MKIIKLLFYLKYILESIGAGHKASGVIIIWLLPYYFIFIHLFLWVFKLYTLPIFDNKIAALTIYLILPIIIFISSIIILLSYQYESETYREFLYIKISKRKMFIQASSFLLIPIGYFGIILIIKSFTP